MRMYKYLPIALAAVVLLSPLSALALSYDSATFAALATNDTDYVGMTATGFIGQMIAVVLSLLGVLFLILTIYAGLLWMTAGGNTENVKKAKSILLNSVVGLIIVLSSYAITATVIRYVSSNAN